MADALIVVTLIGMVGAALLSLIPVLPAAILVWAVATVYAVVTQFERLTPAATIAITAMMIAAATSDLWLRLFGARGQSCSSALGSFIGAILGTFFIPIPVIGTLIGSILGAVIVEMARIRELRLALKSGKIAFQQFLAGMIVNIVISFAMIGIFILSVWSTA